MEHFKYRQLVEEKSFLCKYLKLLKVALVSIAVFCTMRYTLFVLIALFLTFLTNADQRQDRTLLIIQGEWRSLEAVVDSIVLNLITPNTPCDAVLSIGKTDLSLHTEVIKKLSPFLIDVLFPTTNITEISGNGVEFSQITRALRSVDTSQYSFIMKTRTDLFIYQPLSFLTAAGKGDNFPFQFQSFIFRARALYPSTTPCDMISLWLWSGGKHVYLSHAHAALSKKPPLMLWSPHANSVIASELLNSMVDECNMMGIISWDHLSDIAAMRFLISSIVKKYKIMWLQGSTWLSWGAKETFIDVFLSAERAYGSGQHDWRNVPAPLEHLSRSKWAIDSLFPLNKVTEAVLRLAFPLSGANLIELRSAREMYPSFMRNCVLHCFNSSTDLYKLHLEIGAALLRPPPQNCLSLLALPMPVAISISSCYRGYNGCPVSNLGI